ISDSPRAHRREIGPHRLAMLPALCRPGSSMPTEARCRRRSGVPQGKPYGTFRLPRHSAEYIVPQGCSRIAERQMGQVWGYARVSTEDQDTGLQRAALLAAGVPEANIVEEKASGSARALRPLYQALLAHLGTGDTLAVWK